MTPIPDSFLMRLATRETTFFDWSLDVGGVAHTLITGATGAGKSFLLGAMIAASQRQSPLTFLFDFGAGYRTLTEALGGSYLELGVERPAVRINPLGLEPTRDGLERMVRAVRLLAESGGRRFDERDEHDLREAVETLATVPERSKRRLSALAVMLGARLAADLEPFHSGGPYSALFDNEEDTLQLARFQTFNLESLLRHPRAAPAALYWILSGVTESVSDPALAETPKYAWWDEGWKFLAEPTLGAYIEEAFRTWRKLHGAMILATQSVDELAHSAALPILVESCVNHVFLANPRLERSRYKEIFHLNDVEVGLIEQLIPRRQFLLRRPGLSKVLALEVDPESYWTLANSPRENALRRRAIAEWGFEQGLAKLAQGEKTE